MFHAADDDNSILVVSLYLGVTFDTTFSLIPVAQSRLLCCKHGFVLDKVLPHRQEAVCPYWPALVTGCTMLHRSTSGLCPRNTPLCNLYLIYCCYCSVARRAAAAICQWHLTLYCHHTNGPLIWTCCY